MSDWDGLTTSQALRRTVTDLGPEAERWLQSVPALVAQVASEWDLDVGPPLRHEGCASIIAPAVTRQGVAVVLKLSVPHHEARHEADALRQWQGDGAVSVLQASTDGYTLLLERCEPGHDLWGASITDQIEVMTELLPRLWRTPVSDVPFAELAETAARWEQEMPLKAAAMKVPAEIADRAQRWASELATDQPRQLLHGDFHPGNILAARRRAWLAIDPKPWVGDPAFDLAQVLANWIFVDVDAHGGPVDTIRNHARDLAERLSLDLDRVLRWAVVKAIGWDLGCDKTLVLHEAAHAA